MIKYNPVYIYIYIHASIEGWKKDKFQQNQPWVGVAASICSVTAAFKSSNAFLHIGLGVHNILQIILKKATLYILVLVKKAWPFGRQRLQSMLPRCGTPDYFAPELIASAGHSHGAAWKRKFCVPDYNRLHFKEWKITSSSMCKHLQEWERGSCELK